MMRRVMHFMGLTLIAVIPSLIGVPIASAHEPTAHVHGRATLEVAIEGGSVQISLDSPLDSLLGFERAPRNEKERQSVREMSRKLRQSDHAFVFPPQSQCRLDSVQLESAVIEQSLLAAGSDSNAVKDRDKSSVNSPDVHSELSATWHFQCAAPESLQGVKVSLFQYFPSLKRIDAAVVGPKGQSRTRLSPKSNQLKW
jgi:hypothetical protein